MAAGGSRGRPARRTAPAKAAAARKALGMSGFGPELRRDIAKTIRNAGIEIVNGLAEAGPAWSGQFSASWHIVPAGSSPRERNVGELFDVYQYSYRNFQLKMFENALLKNVTAFNIVNTSPHAAQALDFSEGYFERATPHAIKPIIQEGFRPYDFVIEEQEIHYRYQLSPGPRFDSHGNEVEPDSGITAEKDWFETYTVGGGLQRDLSHGIQINITGLG